MFIRFTLYAVKSVTRRIPTFVQLITRLNAILKSLVNRVNVLFFPYNFLNYKELSSLYKYSNNKYWIKASFYLIFVTFNGNSMDYIIIINDTVHMIESSYSIIRNCQKRLECLDELSWSKDLFDFPGQGFILRLNDCISLERL